MTRRSPNKDSFFFSAYFTSTIMKPYKGGFNMNAILFALGMTIIWAPLILITIKVVNLCKESDEAKKKKDEEERLNKQLKNDGFILWNEL